MKNLLIEEMKRALNLLESGIDLTFSWENYKETAELKELLKAIRRHSVLLGKEIE